MTGPPAPAPTAPTRPTPLSQQRTQPVELRVTAEDKPCARHTTEQPLYVVKPARTPATRLTAPATRSTAPHSNGDGLMTSKWAPQPSAAGTGIATSCK